MAEMIPWRFLVFVALFAALIYFQFYLAHRQWSLLKGEQASEIDVNYVRSENYFGQSFRMKVAQWVTLPTVDDKEVGSAILKGNERIRVVENMVLAADSLCDDILVVERDFACGPGSRLRRELLVHGNSNIGAKSILQSLAVNGALFLGEHVSVARWLDAGGELTISAGCKIGSRVTSQKRINLGLGSEVASAYAPEVATAGRNRDLETAETPAVELLEIAVPGDSDAAVQKLAAANLKPAQFTQLGVDTWLYKGGVSPAVPVRITRKLAIIGNCYLPAGSVIEADVRASGSIIMGCSCTIQANVVADKHVFLGPFCRFSGVINAGGELLLSSGTRGFQSEGMVIAYAGSTLSVETDVAIRGKLSAGERVAVVNSAASKAWRKRHRISEDGLPAELGKGV